jgi:diacylglycerol kinase family enzyme
MRPNASFDHHMPSESPPLRVRIVATVALIGYVALTVELLLSVVSNAWPGVVALVGVGVGVPLTWIGATRPRWRGRIAAIAAASVVGGIVALAASAHSTFELVVVLTTIAITITAGTWALGREIRSAVAHRWSPAPPATHGVLLMNTKSGGGKAERYDLVGQCVRRGIEPIVLAPGDDLRALAEDAVARGADVIGMAGGDGSQAVVAAVASANDIPFVCVPAGTRNHFALDLGVDREDVVGSLDAYGDARQARIDLADVNGQVFVNNVSLGVYARIVASHEYRDAKLRTAARMLPNLLGPDATPSRLNVRMPSGALVKNPQVVVVSNNPYRLKSLAGFGTRTRLDRGVLGAAVLLLANPNEVTRFVAAEAAGELDRFPGWQTTRRPRFEVDADGIVAAGVDGEAVELTPPLHFVARPRALTVRISADHLGLSPAALHPGWGRSTFLGLARIVSGRPSGLVEADAPDLSGPR